MVSVTLVTDILYSVQNKFEAHVAQVLYVKHTYGDFYYTRTGELFIFIMK